MGQILSTEDRILDAALTVIQEKTIGGLRIRQVAEKAHLFQSNIHYYYNSKKELLLAVQRKVLNRYREIRQQSINQSGIGPEATLEDHLDIFIKQKIHTILIEDKYDVAELDFWNQSRLDPDMHQEFCRSYQNWRSEIREITEKFAPDMPLAKQNLVAGIAVSLLEGATVQFLVDKEAFDLDSYFAYCKSILIREIRG
ncbi:MULTISPECIES: TetR/AcrR family transcriptional regulator [Lacrimispora]|jgi:AcrR family transcriptional regulator|uniref:TetR/AcrR family transcriptional regulator n=1 Tax=Lacrimispora TaxID=2719231 RepID=UPI000BE2E773|nr:TetR/AcrR family transcriptional regulator [Lacrimispora amygdalina]MDK2965119.1 TetR/AcrR family transcriptional regulator [Lacrimispora sp.]